MNKTKTFLIAVAVMSLMACSESKTERKAEPIAVETETVKAGSDLQGRTYVGVVEEESSTSISFTGSGTLTQVYVEEGQAVRAGQLIAEMDKTQAQNMLAAAEAQMKQANDALARMKQLHDNGSLPLPHNGGDDRHDPGYALLAAVDDEHQSDGVARSGRRVYPYHGGMAD